MIINYKTSTQHSTENSVQKSNIFTQPQNLSNVFIAVHKCSSFNQDKSTTFLQVEGSFTGLSPVNDQLVLYACARPHRAHVENVPSVCKQSPELLILRSSDTNTLRESVD